MERSAGADVPLWLAPPTGTDTKRIAGCRSKTHVVRFFYKTGEVVVIR